MWNTDSRKLLLFLKITTCLELARSMLGTWNLVNKYTHNYVSENYQGLLNFANISIFLQGNLPFLAKIISFVLNSVLFFRPCVRNPSSRLLQISHKSEKWQRRHNLPTWRHHQFFFVTMFLLSSLGTGPSFMSTSLLVLELWQFSFIWNW